MSTIAPTAHPAQATVPGKPMPGIPFSRVVGVELRKMFDTRSGMWLMYSIGILALLATVSVILFAPDSSLDYESFASAIGFPMVVILPIVAILSVTGEWSQRTGLSTFTFIPHRGKVIGAKAVAALLVGVVSMIVAMAVGAVGNVVGSTIAGVDTTWNVSVMELVLITLANVLGMAVGFMLAVLFRNTPTAIVLYFVYNFVLTTAASILAVSQQWFEDIRGWVDFNYAQSALFEGGPTSEQWAQIGVSGLFWLVIPLTIGLFTVLRSEVK